MASYSPIKDRQAPIAGQQVRMIAVDASHDYRLNAAGIAVSAGEQAAHIYRSEAIHAPSVQQAEAAAIRLGIDYLAEQDHEAGGYAVILSDSLDVIRAVYGEVPAETAKVCPEMIGSIRERIDRHNIVLRKVHRTEVGGAHRGARSALRAYRTGVTLAGQGPEMPSARSIAGAVIARLKASRLTDEERGDLAYEIAMHLDNYACDGEHFAADQIAGEV